MALTDVLTDARALPRAEQLRLIQELAAALLRDETPPLIEPGREYPVWSPDAAFGAAAVLLRSLGDDRGQ
ncbi:MAG: hypothetical protein U0791_12910 [Gemmataceae bacterium]